METTKSNHQIIIEFTENLSVKKDTQNQYYNICMQFFKYLENEQINYRNVNRGNYIAWIQFLKETKRERTVQNYILVTKKLFEFMELCSYYKNITAGIIPPKRTAQYSDKKSLTIEEAKKLLLSIDRTTIRGVRDYALILLLLSNGLRTIEAARLKIKDIAQDCIFVRGKGKIDTVKTTIKPETFDTIEEYLLMRKSINDEEYLFQSLSNRNTNIFKPLKAASIGRIIKDRLKAIDLDKAGLTAHSLRHTAVIIAIESGVNIEDIRLFLRHKNMNTTQIYIESITRKLEAENRTATAILNKLLH